MTRDERLQIVDRHLAQLGEHFDAVQIVACRLLPDGSTENYHLGLGNWYARYGLVKEHALRSERDMLALLPPPPECQPDGHAEGEGL